MFGRKWEHQNCVSVQTGPLKTDKPKAMEKLECPRKLEALSVAYSQGASERLQLKVKFVFTVASVTESKQTSYPPRGRPRISLGIELQRQATERAFCILKGNKGVSVLRLCRPFLV